MDVAEARRRYAAKKVRQRNHAVSISVGGREAYYVRQRAVGDARLAQLRALAKKGFSIQAAASDTGICVQSIRKLLREKIGSGAWPPADLERQ